MGRDWDFGAEEERQARRGRDEDKRRRWGERNLEKVETTFSPGKGELLSLERLEKGGNESGGRGDVDGDMGFLRILGNDEGGDIFLEKMGGNFQICVYIFRKLGEICGIMKCMRVVYELNLEKVKR